MHSRCKPDYKQTWVRHAKCRHWPTKIVGVLLFYLIEKIRQAFTLATRGIEYS